MTSCARRRSGATSTGDEMKMLSVLDNRDPPLAQLQAKFNPTLGTQARGRSIENRRMSDALGLGRVETRYLVGAEVFYRTDLADFMCSGLATLAWPPSAAERPGC